MNWKLDKKPIFLFFFSLIFIGKVFGQSSYKIDYYGIVATEIDQNMSKMTSDLYYTQLCEINNFSVSDMREASSLETIPFAENLSKDKLSFYTVISKKDDSGKWTATLTIYNPINNSQKTKTNIYDSYYKILMEPKSFLQANIKDLIEKDSPNDSVDHDGEIRNDKGSVEMGLPPKSTVVSTEFLSGTWSGEDNIDKIVIMRGGRGFVIFTNGASMNILVELTTKDDEKIVTITQNSRANASYFPELSRQLALQEAVTAQPIKWNLTITNDDTLEGTKNTLIEKNGNAIQSDLNVTWKRRS